MFSITELKMSKRKNNDDDIEVLRKKCKLMRRQLFEFTSGQQFVVEDRHQNENRSMSAKRRFSLVKKPKDYQQTLEKIKEETVNDLAALCPNIMHLADALKGQKFPEDIKICHFFNVNKCDKKPVHLENRSDTCRIHVCNLCTMVLGFGLYHKAFECQLLKILDECESVQTQSVQIAQARFVAPSTQVNQDQMPPLPPTAPIAQVAPLALMAQMAQLAKLSMNPKNE